MELAAKKLLWNSQTSIDPSLSSKNARFWQTIHLIYRCYLCCMGRSLLSEASGKKEKDVELPFQLIFCAIRNAELMYGATQPECSVASFSLRNMHYHLDVAASEAVTHWQAGQRILGPTSPDKQMSVWYLAIQEYLIRMTIKHRQCPAYEGGTYFASLCTKWQYQP